LRGTIANRVRNAIFAVFGEDQLPHIDTKSTPQEMKEWKDSEKLKKAYEKLNQRISGETEKTWCARIIQKTWPNADNLSKEKVAFGVAVCHYVLNPQTESLKIDDEDIRRLMKIHKVRNIKKINNYIKYEILKFLFIYRKS
jgi:hypothetical protein